MSGRVTSVCVSGALGSVGRQLVAGIAVRDDFRLHSAVARREHGRDVGEVVLAGRSACRSTPGSRRRSTAVPMS